MIAAFGIPGGWLLVAAVIDLFDVLALIGDSTFEARFALLLSLILIFAALMGAGLLVISWMLYKRDRVGRGLAYVIAASIAASIALSDSPDPQTSVETAVLLGCLAGIAILALSPRVREAFAGVDSRYGEVPTSVVVARVGISFFVWLAVLMSATYLIAGTVEGGFYAVGLTACAVAYLAWKLSGELMSGDRRARNALTAGTGVLLVLALALGRGDPGLNFPIGLLIGVVAFLWLPNDARRFFGDKPLLRSAAPRQ